MDHLQKFFRLPLSKQTLLIQAVVILGAVRTALWLLPFNVLQRISAKLVPPGASRDGTQFSTELESVGGASCPLVCSTRDLPRAIVSLAYPA